MKPKNRLMPYYLRSFGNFRQYSNAIFVEKTIGEPASVAIEAEKVTFLFGFNGDRAGLPTAGCFLVKNYTRVLLEVGRTVVIFGLHCIKI
nr:hypothetical protein Iba_chr01fCG10000 [Ipomoea batatas]